MSSDTLIFEGKSNSKWWLTFLPTPNPPILCALEGSQHCHLGVWSIEGTDLILLPLTQHTQHGMQKITWAIATADVRWGKPYVCRFVDRSNKDKQGKSSNYDLEYWHKNDAGILLFCKSCDVHKITQVHMHQDRHQASVSKVTSGAPERVSMSEAGEDELFGDLSSACSSQIWPWGAVNKQKQANSSKRRIRECRGPSIQPTFHRVLREATLHVFKIFKERINFLSTSADETIWVAQLQTHQNHQMSHHRLSCKSTLPAAPVRQLQGMHSKNCFSDFSAPWF